MYNRAELENIAPASEILFEQHKLIVDSICQAKPAAAEKAAHKHIDFVIELIENAFQSRNREALSKKRYRNLEA